MFIYDADFTEYNHAWSPYNLGEFNKIRLTFTTRDIETLKLLQLVCRDTIGCLEIVADVKPKLKPINYEQNKDGISETSLIQSYDADEWDRAFYIPEIKVDEHGTVSIRYYCREHPGYSEASDFSLENLG